MVGLGAAKLNNTFIYVYVHLTLLVYEVQRITQLMGDEVQRITRLMGDEVLRITVNGG